MVPVLQKDGASVRHPVGRSHFGLKFARDSIEAFGNDWGHVLNWGPAMGIGRPPHNKQDLLAGLFRAADNVVPLRHRGDEFSDVLSPLLEAAATFPNDESPRQGFLSLLEENARLRALAVKLSNLLGDLPAREWEDAGAGGADSPPVRCLPK